jgi:hypothetical protein
MVAVGCQRLQWLAAPTDSFRGVVCYDMQRPDDAQIRGDGEANLGWWSDRIESRVPSSLVGGMARGATPLVMPTVSSSPHGQVDSVADLTVAQERSLITVA